jgi:DNA replication protein DnaC
MLINPIINKLQRLRLHTMARAFKEQMEQPLMTELSFEDRLGLLVDQEVTARENRQLQARLKKARLQLSASFEDIDYQSPRNLDKALLASLSSAQWVTSHHNILIIGPTGTGKTFLGCALAHKACLYGHSALYYRMNRLLSDLQLNKGDGQYNKRMGELSKIDVLILDDFGLASFTEEQCRDLLEILDDRFEKRSTIVTSQVPLKLWFETIGNGTLADAILDRLVHNAHRLEIKGESMRKTLSKIKKEDKPDNMPSKQKRGEDNGEIAA